MKAPVLVASAFLLAAAPTFAQQVPAETAATNHRFEQAFNRGDAAALAALYTETATLLPPGADLMTGRQAAQSFWQATYGSGARNLSLNTVSVKILWRRRSGDRAVQRERPRDRAGRRPGSRASTS